MGHAIRVVVDGADCNVDGRDAAMWAGKGAPLHDTDGDAAEIAAAYVEANPRVARRAKAQQIILLRRLAAGAASPNDLLRCLRSAGWVGASDLENRLRDLRGKDKRAGSGEGLPIVNEHDQYLLAAPFPLLGDADLQAIGFAQAMLEQLQGALPRRAEATLHHIVPGVATMTQATTGTRYRASLADYARFYAAYTERRPVKVRYHSHNSDREGTYYVVPVEYVSLTPTVKALCIEVTAEGRRTNREHPSDRQLAIDRLIGVEDLPAWTTPDPEDVQLSRTAVDLTVSDSLYRVMVERNLLGVSADTTYKQDPYDQSWRVRGAFPTALSWDVMEQLCAWAGQVQVHEPLWLVNAVLRRLRAGMRAMEEGDGFALVKPEPDRRFGDLREAVTVDTPMPEQSGPRKLSPPE